jgi:hypothetical protein
MPPDTSGSTFGQSALRMRTCRVFGHGVRFTVADRLRGLQARHSPSLQQAPALLQRPSPPSPPPVGAMPALLLTWMPRCKTSGSLPA